MHRSCFFTYLARQFYTIRTPSASMNNEKLIQSDFMTVQVAEIMKFRKRLQSKSNEIITFQDAVMIWISQGLAEKFRDDYKKGKYEEEPVKA